MVYLKCFMLAGYLSVSAIGHAQTMRFSDLFGQKRKARRYLVEQIAQLQIYIGLAGKGYEVIQSGLTTIEKLKKGEFNLHELFYLSLKNINAEIFNDPHFRSIAIHHMNCSRIISSLEHTVSRSERMKPGYKQFFLHACKKLDEDIFADQAALEQLMTSNKLELTDNERLTFINNFYVKSTKQLNLIRQLTAQALSILQTDLSEQAELNFLRELHQLNP